MQSQYGQTSLYAIDRDRKICLAYKEFAYKKTKDDCKLDDRFCKQHHSQSHACKFADKKTTYKEARLYLLLI